jgi:hypothetical protein
MNLQLSLKKQWFEMTKSGIKTEDYREITPYWIKRLSFVPHIGNGLGYPLEKKFKESVFKKFTTNTMTLGYPKSTDTDRILKFEHAGIEIRTGNPEWGAEPNKLYFVIKHGKLIK